MSGYLWAAQALLCVLVVLAIVGLVLWVSRSKPAPVPQPARDSDYESTLTSPPPLEPTGREVTVPAARVWRDMPPGWVNTVPTGPVPLDALDEPEARP